MLPKTFLLFVIANLQTFANAISATNGIFLSWPEDCGEDALENALLGEYFHESLIKKEETTNLRGSTDGVHRRLNCGRRSRNRRARNRYCGRRDRRLELNLPMEADSEASSHEEEVHSIVEIMLAKCTEMNDPQCQCALNNYWLTFN